MFLSHKDFFDGQMKESRIKRLMEIKEGNINPQDLDKSKEDINAKLMLRDLDELEIGKNNLLHRNTRDKRQLVLPQKFKPVIYLELHVKREREGITANQRKILLA